MPNEATRHAASQGIGIVGGEFLSVTGREFSAITFWAVLEHVAAPGAFLRHARRLLKPGGLCFALAPNINSLAVRLLGSKYRYIPPQHVNYVRARAFPGWLKGRV